MRGKPASCRTRSEGSAACRAMSRCEGPAKGKIERVASEPSFEHPASAEPPVSAGRLASAAPLVSAAPPVSAGPLASAEPAEQPEAAVERLLRSARSRLTRLLPAQVPAELAGGAVLVDIRPVEQRGRDGTVSAAVVIGRNVLEWRAAIPARAGATRGWRTRGGG